MQPSNSPGNSVRLRRSRRFLALIAGLLVVIGIALFAGFIKNGTESSRFAKLYEGMTPDEVKAVLIPSNLDPVQMTSVVFAANGEKLVGADTGVMDCFQYSENSLFPEFVVSITYVDGHLKDKHLQKPTLRQILEFWWHQVGRR